MDPSLPRCCKWDFIQLHHIMLPAFRREIDDLSLDDVIFTPYEDHRQYAPLREMAYFRGWLVYADTAVRYMPDRVRWQFGLVQVIPDDPLGPRPTMREILGALNFWQPRARKLRQDSITIPPEVAFQIADGYYEWYVSQSLPRLILEPGSQCQS